MPIRIPTPRPPWCSTRTLSVKSPAIPEHLGEPVLQALRLEGDEGVNSLFQYQLTLRTLADFCATDHGTAGWDLNSFIDQPMSCRIQIDNSSVEYFKYPGHATSGLGNGTRPAVREINGIVTAAEFLGDDGDQAQYRLTLRPSLFKGTLSANCRIFQNMTAGEILRDVAGRHQSDLECKLTRMLPKRTVETPNGPGVLIRRLDTADARDSTIQSELHVLVKNRYVILVAESFPPESAFNYRANDAYKLADPVAAEKRLILVAQYLSPITDPERAGPGICMNGILIDQWQAGFDEEQMTFHFNSTNDEQPKFEVNMFGRFGYDKETLFDRADRSVSELSKLTDEVIFRQIRRTVRQIGGMSFQEWAHEGYMKTPKTTQFAFVAQSLAPEPKDKRLERPSTLIVLNSGEEMAGKSSPYSAQQLEEAWDQWISTFRLSPGNGGKPQSKSNH